MEELPGGPIPGALRTVRYPDQWMIQPTDYLRLLATRIVDHGGRLVLGLAVRQIEGGSPSRVVTDHGTIAADHVVAATHVPLGLVPAMLPWQPVRHHAVVFDTDAEVPMALDVDGGWSVRPVPPGTEPGSTAHRGLALGSEHAVGEDDTTGAGALHRWATGTWDARVVDTWSSQDSFVADHLPIVGRLGGIDRVFTATGFGGWGLALGTAAGMDLAKRLSTDNASERWGFWSLTPGRLAALAPAIAKQGAQGTGKLVAGNVTSVLSNASADELSPGQGIVVREGTNVRRPVAGRRWPRPRGQRALHSHGLHRQLEQRGAVVGLRLPRVALLTRRRRAARTRGQAARPGLRLTARATLRQTGRP